MYTSYNMLREHIQKIIVHYRKHGVCRVPNTLGKGQFTIDKPLTANDFMAPWVEAWANKGVPWVLFGSRKSFEKYKKFKSTRHHGPTGWLSWPSAGPIATPAAPRHSAWLPAARTSHIQPPRPPLLGLLANRGTLPPRTTGALLVREEAEKNSKDLHKLLCEVGVIVEITRRFQRTFINKSIYLVTRPVPIRDSLLPSTRQKNSSSCIPKQRIGVGLVVGVVLQIRIKLWATRDATISSTTVLGARVETKSNWRTREAATMLN